MDPFSIACTIGTVLQTTAIVSLKIYAFIDQTQSVGQAIKDLAREIEALESALRGVESRLRSRAIQRVERWADDPEEKAELWDSVDQGLQDCNATLSRLQDSIEDVTNEHTNVAGQLVRSIKLKLRDGEISSLQSQIRGHCNNLQITLHMITLRAVYLGPGAVADELGPKIEVLQTLIEQMQPTRSARLSLPGPGMSPRLTGLQHSSSLRRSAEKVLSSASTAYATSAAGSILGKGMDDLSRRRTFDWIEDPVVEETIAIRSLSVASSSHTDPFASVRQADTAPTTMPDSVPSPYEPDDHVESFEFEVCSRLIGKGVQRYETAHYPEALELLQSGLKRAEGLPIGRSTHSESLCQALHFSAAIYLRQNTLKSARVHCLKAVNGRRGLFGHRDRRYCESLYLLSKICDADGSPEEGNIYRDMIEPSILQTLWGMDFVATLSPRPTTDSLATLVNETPPGRPAISSPSPKIRAFGVARTASNDLPEAVLPRVARTASDDFPEPVRRASVELPEAVLPVEAVLSVEPPRTESVASNDSVTSSKSSRFSLFRSRKSPEPAAADQRRPSQGGSPTVETPLSRDGSNTSPVIDIPRKKKEKPTKAVKSPSKSPVERPKIRAGSYTVNNEISEELTWPGLC